jgi:hypothetical protein
MSGLDFIERDSPEWHRAWAVMRERYGALDGWQYLGTTGGFHEFRHRGLDARTVPAGTWGNGSRARVRPGDGLPDGRPGFRVYDWVRAATIVPAGWDKVEVRA